MTATMPSPPAAAAPSIERSPIEARVAAALQAGSHPFLDFGRAEEVEARLPTGAARLIASIDSRQVTSSGPVGSIGFIEARGDPAAFEEALIGARRWLRGLGVTDVRCPVNLSTWYGHQTIVEGFPGEGGSPRFFLEPAGAPWLPRRLEAQGFLPASRGVATLVPNARAVAGTAGQLQRAEAAGYRDRPLDLAAPAVELDLLHRLASTIFEGAAGFSMIAQTEFHALYGPMLGAVDPQLVRILESRGGEPVGFAFAVADRDGPPAGEPGAQFVFKTIGVLPAVRRQFPGLGWAMVSRVHALAGESGFAQGVHANAAKGSYSARTSARWGTPFRGYASFRRRP